MVLTAARSGEARGATWAEIDLDARLWTVLAERMKANVEHRVPLSKAALAVLEQARALRDKSDLLFPSPRKPGQTLSNMSLTKMLRDTELASRATTHGSEAVSGIGALRRASHGNSLRQLWLIPLVELRVRTFGATYLRGVVG